MRCLFLLVLGVLFLNASPPLSLDEALQKLHKQNTELSIADLDMQIAALEHKIAQGASFGSLDLTQSALRSNEALTVFGFKLQSREVKNSDFLPDLLNNPKSRNHFDTALEYTLPLYSGGKIELFQKITQTLKELKNLEKEQQLAQKEFELKKIFYTLSLLQEHASQLRIILGNVEKMYERTFAFQSEGYAKKVDVLEVETRKNNVERVLHQIQTAHSLALNFLSFLLNEKIEAIVLVNEEISFTKIEKDKALSQSLELQKATKAIEISQMNTQVEKSAFFPTLGAVARYGSADNQFLSNLSQNDYYTVGLMMRWNLFHGGIDKAKLEKSRVELLKAKQQLSLAQQFTMLRLDKLSLEINSDDFEIRNLTKELVLAERIYDNYTERYHEKLVPIYEVLLKQSEAINTRLRLHEVQNRRIEKIFEYEMIVNKELL